MRQSANTANLRVLATFADGSKKVVCVGNDLGVNRQDPNAVMAALLRQGVENVVKVDVAGAV